MTIKKFLKGLKKARKQSGAKFQLIEIRKPIRISKKKCVRSLMLCWIAPQKSIWSPVSFFHNSKQDKWGKWLTTDHAAIALGISKTDSNIIKNACCEAKHHDSELRKQVLKACEVKEIQHKDRNKYKCPKKQK